MAFLPLQRPLQQESTVLKGWQAEYNEGMQYELYRVQLSASCSGKSFKEVREPCENL